MNPSATIPVTVNPDAAARAAQLGIRADLDRMLEYLEHNVPGLHAITVTFDPAPKPWERRVGSC